MKTQDWTRGQIRLELERIGYTCMQKVDADHGLSCGVVSNTIRHPYEAGERVLSQILGVPAATIWPSRYDASGHRLSPQPMSAYRAVRAAGHGQKAKAA